MPSSPELNTDNDQSPEGSPEMLDTPEITGESSDPSVKAAGTLEKGGFPEYKLIK